MIDWILAQCDWVWTCLSGAALWVTMMAVAVNNVAMKSLYEPATFLIVQMALLGVILLVRIREWPTHNAVVFAELATDSGAAAMITATAVLTATLFLNMAPPARLDALWAVVPLAFGVAAMVLGRVKLKEFRARTEVALNGADFVLAFITWVLALYAILMAARLYELLVRLA